MTHPPEPWHLTGRMDVSTFLVPAAELPALDAPPGHSLLRLAGRVPVGAAWVDYDTRGVLSYRELLVAVATRQGAALRGHITHIWVDSTASRDGGRGLWGIPKGLAEFDAAAPGDDPADGVRRCTPHDAAREVATATVRRGRRAPGRAPVGFAVAQHRAVAGVPGLSALVSPVRTRAALGSASLDWVVDPDGALGFLAGRAPVVSSTLHDFAMMFGMTPDARARA